MPARANPKALDADAEVSAIKTQIAASLAQAQVFDTPYRHWTLANLFPDSVVEALFDLPFMAPDLGGVSGKRELHNDTRTYFNDETMDRRPVCAALARAFHDSETVATIVAATGARLDNTFLRIEFAQDIDGFWLQPHTDEGAKMITLLYYLAEDGQQDLGTDIYAAADSWAKRAPFVCNEALVFVPGDHTWHGFEKRRIEGVRKSVIVNYVTDEWRDRTQLAYPETRVRSASIRRTV